MRLKGLMNPLKESSEFNEIINYLQGNKYPINISGVSKSGKSFIVNGIFEELNESMVIITSSEMEAKNIYEDL